MCPVFQIVPKLTKRAPYDDDDDDENCSARSQCDEVHAKSAAAQDWAHAPSPV